MEIIYKASAFKQLKKIPKTELNKIRSKLEALEKDPYAGKALKGKLQGFYSVKPWPYRIIYEITKQKIVTFSVSHKQGSYK
jgi:addiction module RelE/StbE family toxin